MKLALLAVVGLTPLDGLHRLALYYLRRQTSTSALGNAVLELQSIIEPEKQRLVEVQRAEEVEEDAQGEPPKAGNH